MWKPEKADDSITGVGINKEAADKTRELSAGDKLENKEGIFLVCGSTTLDDRMQHIGVGDTVRITFKEKKDIGKGKTLKIFKVERQQTQD